MTDETMQSNFATCESVSLTEQSDVECSDKMLMFFANFVYGEEFRNATDLEYMCDVYLEELMTPVVCDLNDMRTDSARTILGALFVYIKYAEDEGFLTSICTIIQSILERTTKYRYELIYDGCDMYQHIQYCCNLQFYNNDAQLSLIALIASYYFNNNYAQSICYVIDRVKDTELYGVFNGYSLLYINTYGT